MCAFKNMYIMSQSDLSRQQQVSTNPQLRLSARFLNIISHTSSCHAISLHIRTCNLMFLYVMSLWNVSNVSLHVSLFLHVNFVLQLSKARSLAGRMRKVSWVTLTCNFVPVLSFSSLLCTGHIVGRNEKLGPSSPTHQITGSDTKEAVHIEELYLK